MEKKSIGSFIAVLRKAKGMTQQDLAHKLNVSNKTVSKWECDETYPDISLIPVIAEVLEVSCDELLKGERILRDNEQKDEKTDKKITKQLKHLVDKNVTKFKLFTMLNIMLIILGGLVNFIISYIVYRPDIGFWIMSGVIIIGIMIEIILLIFLNGKFNDKELFDNNGIDLEKTVNTVKYKYSFAVLYLSFSLIFLTLPLILARLLWDGIMPIKSVLSFNYYVERLLYFIIVPIICFSPLQSLYKNIFIKNSIPHIKVIIFDFVQLVLIIFSHVYYKYDHHESNDLEEWHLALIFTALIIIVGTVFLLCLTKSISKDKRFKILTNSIRNMMFLFIPVIGIVSLNYALIAATTALSFVKNEF